MKGVKLSERIRYMSMRDEDGYVGVMMLLPTRPTRSPLVRSIETNDQFVSALEEMRRLEQEELGR